MDEKIKVKIEEASTIISNANAEKLLKNETEAKKLFEKAGDLEIEIYKEFRASNNALAIIHYISAIACFISSDNYTYALSLIEDIRSEVKNQAHLERLNEFLAYILPKIKADKNNDLSDSTILRIYRLVLLYNQRKYGKTRSTLNFQKEMFEVKRRIHRRGKTMQENYEALYNPIFSKDINEFIKNCEENNYVKIKADRSITLQEPFRIQLQEEIEETEEILKNIISEDIIESIWDVIEMIGDKTGKELENGYEKSVGVTKYQFKRAID